MKVKKYVAKSMPEAMNQIRKELGPEAVILHSKEVVNGGFLGFFKKKNIEVVAALDPQPLPLRKNDSPDPAPVVQEKDQARANNDNNDMLQEIRDLKKLFEIQSRQEIQTFPPVYQLAYEDLRKQEVEEKLAEELIRTVIDELGDTEEEITIDLVKNHVRSLIERNLTHHRSQGIGYDKKVIQFVGPTGVGKTTTIAKIAAKMMLDDQKKVAFITADTYRIGAVEQLKTYARILDVPIEVAYTIDDYYAAIEKFSAYDVILVDTAGRNFRDKKYIEELESILDMRMMNTYLVLSLTTKQKDLMEIYEQFQHLNIRDVIFTKLDETSQYGSILNISMGKQVGVACIANGQDVPEDLMESKPEYISKLLVGDHDGK
ncbi:flagellar biosynthesis protein FlhF [Oceanobacillus damuensis]|uniref:flagellar biosynthesis protein FlhF n=1 Tax=Oceanobacillus damuensis TaxID=937928 RepID=UPI00082C3983|nr:flagellar biosynthesis protein FlhF [Oceanobacillus damuensis]